MFKIYVCENVLTFFFFFTYFKVNFFHTGLKVILFEVQRGKNKGHVDFPRFYRFGKQEELEFS